jgi:hypothetical protein
MAAALAANGVAYEYVVYPNRGDLWLPVNPKFQHDAMQRTVDWMKKWLLAGARPARAPVPHGISWRRRCGSR